MEIKTFVDNFITYFIKYWACNIGTYFNYLLALKLVSVQTTYFFKEPFSHPENKSNTGSLHKLLKAREFFPCRNRNYNFRSQTIGCFPNMTLGLAWFSNEIVKIHDK